MSQMRFMLPIVAVCTSYIPASAQPTDLQPPIDKTIIYIECKSADGRTSRGSGVLVSGEGAILTAKHVAPLGFSCMGGIGTAATTPTRRLIRDTRQVPVDAIILKFVRASGETFPFVHYRRIQDSLRGKSIVAHGFPREGAGDVFQTEGVIAQTNIDERGIVGTSALTSSGMSGGPVLFKEDGSLIGIVVGADFNSSTGTPSSFGVLAAQEVATILELKAISMPSREVDPGAAIGTPVGISGYDPQYEGLLRETLVAVARGTCPDTMSPMLHATCDQQMPNFARIMKQRGSLVSTKFVGVQPTPMGNAETYDAVFSQGRMVWLINTTPDGKILAFWSPSQ